MELNELGVVIKDIRERYGASRDGIATPLCDATTIYRIEEGIEEPQKDTVCAIFNALGTGMPVNIFSATTAEYERYVAEEKLIWCRENGFFAHLLPLAEIYRNAIIEMDSFEIQVYHLHRALYFLEAVRDYDSAVSEVNEALKSTGVVLGEDLEPLLEKFITRNEMECIETLAFACLGRGEKDHAEKIFEFIVNYVRQEKFTQLSEIRFGMNALLNLCRLCSKKKDSVRLGNYAQKGISLCTSKGMLAGFLQFHFYEGKSRGESGDDRGKRKALLCDELIKKYGLYLANGRCILKSNEKPLPPLGEIWDENLFDKMDGGNAPIVCRLLRDTRRRKKLTQEDVCRGVCTKSNYSRIESGKVIPDINQIRIFFTRMGVTVPKRLTAVTKWQKKRYDLEARMHDIWFNADDRRPLLIEEYKNVRPKMSVLEKQVMLLNQAIEESLMGEGREKSIQICREALALTKTNPDICTSKNMQTLSYIERNLINSMAHSEFYLYDEPLASGELKDDAVKKEYALKEYHEKFVEGYTKIRLYTTIHYNLTNWRGIAREYGEALNLAEGGFKYSCECNSLYYFMTEMYNQAFILIGIGLASDTDTLLFDFAALSKLAPGELDDVEDYLSDIKEFLGYDIPESVIERINNIPV